MSGQVVGPTFLLPEEPHRVVFWSCTWGINYAYLVWQFCNTLTWPDPGTPPTHNDPGISWTVIELAISFMLWSGRFSPIKIQEEGYSQALEYARPKVQIQPLKKRSIRVMAETFRLIIKHIQTFSRTNFADI